MGNAPKGTGTGNGSSYYESDNALDEVLRHEFNQKKRNEPRFQKNNRRNSVSLNVRSMRPASTRVHENLMKINLTRKIEDVYKGIHSRKTKIGEGTWGKVHKVIRRGDKSRYYAVKVLQLSQELDDNRMKELKTEISLLQSIDHPHIVKVYETYEDEGLYLYIVMELLKGGELFDRVTDLGNFTEDKAASAIKQMVGAINYLHSIGIVHRDLKLENFMYRGQYSDELVLIDFGLSTKYKPVFEATSKRPPEKNDKLQKNGEIFKMATRLFRRKAPKSQSLKSSGNSSGDQVSGEAGDENNGLYMNEMVGSSYYMAPEVMERRYGRECDMWSIGVIAYMLLSGHPPFAGESDSEIMKRVRRGKYHFNHSAFRRVSSDAKAFVSNLLQYNPKDRMTAREALAHPWLTTAHQKQVARRSVRRQRRGSIMHDGVVSNLKNFVQTNRFKKLALQAVAYSTSYDDIKELQDLFEDIDQDQDGYITLEELKNALSDNENVNAVEVEQFFEAMDINKSQKVHLNEFIAATIGHSIMEDESVLREAFQKLNVSDTGRITINDLKQVLGENFDRRQAKKMMEEFAADAREHGKDFQSMTTISMNDFLRSMRRAKITKTRSLIAPMKIDSNEVNQRKRSSIASEPMI